MLPTFLSQLAAGTLLIVAGLPLRQVSWKYLRLIAIVSICIAVMASVLCLAGSGSSVPGFLVPIFGLVLAIGAPIAWITVHHRKALRAAGDADAHAPEGFLPMLGGVAAMCAAVMLALRRDVQLPIESSVVIPAPSVLIAITTILGAVLLGGALAGMLLGHRYLTDTDMSIAPLRRLTQFYVVIVAVRLLWTGGFLAVFFLTDHEPVRDELWFYVVLSLRAGIGLLGTAVFAYMIWDCVRRRATQSATAIYYLSMLFVVAGELTAQYLVRANGLPL